MPFNKLRCEQMEKFVDVGLDMKNSIDRMASKIGHMSGKLDAVNGKFDVMNSKLDTLPQNMAREIVRLRKEGFF